MKSIEQIADEVRDDMWRELSPATARVFAKRLLEAYLAQQTPIAYVYLHDIQRSREMGTYAAAYPVQVRTVVDKSVPVFLASPTSPEGFENAINEAVKAEREACARVADDWQLDDDCETYLCSCATAIRERVEKK